MIGGCALGKLDPSLEGVLSLTHESLRTPPPGLPPIKSGVGHPPPTGEGWR
jgi:hypothetical protein